MVQYSQEWSRQRSQDRWELPSLPAGSWQALVPDGKPSARVWRSGVMAVSFSWLNDFASVMLVVTCGETSQRLLFPGGTGRTQDMFYHEVLILRLVTGQEVVVAQQWQNGLQGRGVGHQLRMIEHTLIVTCPRVVEVSLLQGVDIALGSSELSTAR